VYPPETNGRHKVAGGRLGKARRTSALGAFLP
jgi:hypothetical protein